MTQKELESVKQYSSGINEGIRQKIEDIKTLPFVQSIKIVSIGIEIDVGKVDVHFRDKDIYIGDFTIIISPTNVKIKCRNPVDADCGYYLEHPHIDSGSHICYGDERGAKIEEYFAQYEFKKLVYFVYLFLKSYNSMDKYNSITYWTADNIKRKRLEE
jgi:hypothetical protein